MGNTFVFRNSSSNFVEQLKIDSKGNVKVIGIYINPNEFPTGGLIVVSERQILSYNPIYGDLNTSFSFPTLVLFSDYNRKSKDGSLLACVTADMKCYLVSTETLTINRTVSILTKGDLHISDNSKITCINFKLNNAVLLACSDGSVIKCKLNDEPVNLLYETSQMKFSSPEDEFESIKNVFSSDLTNQTSFTFKHKPSNNNHNNTNNGTSIQQMLISDRYKVLFCISKNNEGISNVSLFNLRNNVYMCLYAKVKGIIQCGALADKRDILLLVSFIPETKITTLQLWLYNDNRCPISTFNISDLLQYKFTISSINLTRIPNIFYGRYSNHGSLQGDILTMGTTKGDIIIGSICNLHTNNKLGYEHLMIYKLNSNGPNEISKDDYGNKFEISYIGYDLNFDVLYIGDVNSNVRFIEKVLQIGRRERIEENLPFFSFDNGEYNKGYIIIENEKKEDNNSNNNTHNDNNIQIKKIVKFPEQPKKNYDLPIISINHDVIKDRSIILYDKGENVIVTKYKRDEVKDGDTSDEYDEDEDIIRKDKLTAKAFKEKNAYQHLILKD